jgi:two-component system response regulator RegA
MAETWKSRGGTALVVEDDSRLLSALLSTLERKSRLKAVGASTLAHARDSLRTLAPDACIVDMQLPDGCGLDLIREIRASHAKARIILTTGYGSMEVGAMAVRAGADDVIAKPAAASEIMLRLLGEREPLADETPTADRAVWEHAHRVLHDCGGNKSLAARKLGVDRGTLQRWLDRGAPTH